MSIRITAIGLGVVAALASAHAQDGTPPARLAAVDASGRILPIAGPSSTSVERIDDAFRSMTPCAGAKAMPPDDAQALVVRIAAEEHFSTNFVQAVAKNESHFNSIARSDKGAFGLMQLTADTAHRFKVDVCDPADNVRGGVRFLRALNAKYSNPLFVLAAYNAGEGAVEENRGIPPFPETVRFVAQVLNDFYAWPGLSVTARRGTAPTGSQPDLIEPELVNAGRHSSASPGRWDDGFVMHVD